MATFDCIGKLFILLIGKCIFIGDSLLFQVETTLSVTHNCILFLG